MSAKPAPLRRILYTSPETNSFTICSAAEAPRYLKAFSVNTVLATRQSKPPIPRDREVCLPKKPKLINASKNTAPIWLPIMLEIEGAFIVVTIEITDASSLSDLLVWISWSRSVQQFLYTETPKNLVLFEATQVKARALYGLWWATATKSQDHFKP